MFINFLPADTSDVQGPSGGMDDLDTALFGKPLTQKKKTPNALSSILSGGQTESSAPKRSVVSFLEPSTSSSATPQRAPRSTLSDILGDTPTPAVSTRPSRVAASTPSVSAIPKPSPAVVEAPLSRQRSESVSDYDQVKIQRLEDDLGRLHREIDDLKRKKREDEEDIEKIWKERLLKTENESELKLDNLKKDHQRQLDKIKEEYETEIDRLKTVYARQLNDLTSLSGQAKDVSHVAEKVNSLTDVIEKIATNINVSKNHISNEQEMMTRLKEEAVNNREERLRIDIERFEIEKSEVHELNLRLNEMCKQQERDLNGEKYKIREQQRRLEAEKKLFKEDQNYIIETISKQKAEFEEKMNKFYAEQHDLLVRVNMERQMIENEKNEFSAKRNVDIRRLREEAGKLDVKVQQVITAERHIQDLQNVYESKLRQLYDLEASLMDECFEMEKMRKNIRPIEDQRIVQVDNDVEQSSSQQTSVRAALKRHSEQLEKYTGNNLPKNL